MSGIVRYRKATVMPTAHAIMILAMIALPASPLLAQDDKTIVVEGQRPEKKVCKKFDAPTGSRFGERRICQTKAEWDLAEAAAQRTIDRAVQQLNADRARLENEKNALSRGLPR